MPAEKLAEFAVLVSAIVGDRQGVLRAFQCSSLRVKCPWEPHVFKAWSQLVARFEEALESFRGGSGGEEE